jgi:hypothetical protein
VDNKTVELRSAATKVTTGERRKEINKEYCSLYAWLILCHVAVQKIYRNREHHIFLCRHRLWRPDGAQVLRPGNLVDNEEWEADY